MQLISFVWIYDCFKTLNEVQYWLQLDLDSQQLPQSLLQQLKAYRLPAVHLLLLGTTLSTFFQISAQGSSFILSCLGLCEQVASGQSAGRRIS